MTLSSERLVSALARAFDSPFVERGRSHLSAAMVRFALAEVLESPCPPQTIGELRDALACGAHARVLNRINMASVLARWPADTPLDRVAHDLGEASA